MFLWDMSSIIKYTSLKRCLVIPFVREIQEFQGHLADRKSLVHPVDQLYLDVRVLLLTQVTQPLLVGLLVQLVLFHQVLPV